MNFYFFNLIEPSLNLLECDDRCFKPSFVVPICRYDSRLTDLPVGHERRREERLEGGEPVVVAHALLVELRARDQHPPLTLQPHRHLERKNKNSNTEIKQKIK